ncbi:MAG: SGNH/GDSL hydrolase family protein [Chitinophagaceae bacterium]|nr:MAG: SGNH/GDSL hydrolase family protein [Chitinophagaceae bacterium]
MKKIIIIFLVAVSFLSFSPPPASWTAIGDSITYLNDHLDETGNRVTKGYLTLVGEKMPGLTIMNQGHNGWTSGGIAEKFGELGISKSDIYTIFLGTNDWWQGRPLGSLSDYTSNTGNATVNGSFRIIVNNLRALNPAARIVLITPMQRGDFVYLTNFKNNAWGSYKPKKEQSLQQFAAAIMEIARVEHFDVVDLYNKSGINQKNMTRFKRLKDPKTGLYRNYKYPDFIDIPFDPATDEYPYPPESINMTYDALHPSDKGYQVIAGMLLKVFKRYQ